MLYFWYILMFSLLQHNVLLKVHGKNGFPSHTWHVCMAAGLICNSWGCVVERTPLPAALVPRPVSCGSDLFCDPGSGLNREPSAEEARRRRLRRLRWRSQQGNGGSALRAEGPARPCLPPLCCLPAGWMMIEQKYTVCWLIYVTLSDSIVQQPHDVWSLPQLSTEGKAERRRRKLHSWSECEMYEDGGAEDSHTCKYE